MRKINYIATALILSLFLHLFIACYLSLYINSKANPIFYSWVGIFRKGDFLLKNHDNFLPPGINFSAANLNKKYFLSSMLLQKPPVPSSEIKIEALPFAEKEIMAESDSIIKEETGYVYLWGRPSGLPYWEDENTVYKVLVSPYGKVILAFPEKLPLNSYGSLALQEYIRESTIFLKDKFCWTKLDGIVK
ncbi:MAG: hypothetical protein Q8O30_05915 [Candidatus Omnitrophota bacterium]|nr:hypothetical protein [Candidatus Omnitrophota bacterium]